MMKKFKPISSLIIVSSFLIGAWAYSKMPAEVASHWGMSGDTNGSMGRFWGTFFVPVFMTIVYIILYFAPKIDPRNQNVEKFRASYDKFLNVFLIFFLAIYLYMISWNLGHHLNISIIMSLGLAGLFYAVGNLIKNAEPNWFVGIRNPWTLSSDNVWKKTHELGSKLFKIAALICLLGLVLPKFAFVFIIVPVIVFSFYLMIFSYFEFAKETKSK
ncbi:MAG: SdpI family protein [Candidatus Berkelbacteria bacterium]|nr:SdpI family protein [Candidatus Berkelbacteria bacterium]